MQATTDNTAGLQTTEVDGVVPTCSGFWLFGSVGITSFAIIGFIGNSFIVYVFGLTKNKTPTMYLIQNLAKADALVCISYVSLIFPPSFKGGIVTVLNVAFFSNIVYTLNQISIFFTCILVWQRYVAICKPHSAKTWSNMRTLRIITYTALAFSIIAYFPGFFKHRLVTEDTGEMQAVLTSLGKNNLFFILHTIIFMNLISYVLPTAINLFASINLIKSLSQATVSESSSRAKKELTLSVVMIVVIFILLQFFRPLRYIFMWVYSPYSEAIRCGGKLMYFAPAPVTLTLLNASVNYFVYVVCARGFRKKIIAIVCRKKTSAVGEASKTDTELDLEK